MAPACSPAKGSRLMARGRKSRRKDPLLKKRPTTQVARSPTDRGTPELLAQRLRQHGMPDIGTEHPLDALAAKGLLCPRQTGEETGDWMARNVVARDIGARLGSLHRALHGKSHAPALDPNSLGGKSLTAESPKDVRMEQDYKAMRQALSKCGRRVFDAVMNRAVYCRKMPPVESSHWRSELDAIRTGLDALVNMGSRMQRAA